MHTIRWLFATAALGCGVAQAGYIQSLGQGQRCIALGGACVAIADDFAAYYYNPAGAAQLRRPTVGGNFLLLDTRHLGLRDGAGNHDIPSTNGKGAVVLAPTLAGYIPLDGGLTFGIGFGAPFGVSADWTNQSGIHRYNMSEQALLLLDVTPTVAYRVNERLSIGAGLNITAFKHMRTETLIPDSFGAALPPSMGGTGTVIPTTPTSPTIGAFGLQSKKDVHLGIPPDNFASGFREFALTLGALYKATDRLALGAAFRSKTRTTWKGDLRLDLSPSGGPVQSVPFELDMDMPAHVEAGFAYQVVPDRLTWSFDVQRTLWSRTRGLGRPTTLRLGAPLLGFVNGIQVSYDARDANTYRTGIQYRLRPDITLMAGYAYDQRVFSSGSVDILTYDSDRQLFSVGAGLDRRDGTTGTGWKFNTAAQLTRYRKRDIAPGESRNLGGVSLPNLVKPDTIGFTPNRGPFSFGGRVWTVGVSAEYAF